MSEGASPVVGAVYQPKWYGSRVWVQKVKAGQVYYWRFAEVGTGLPTHAMQIGKFRKQFRFCPREEVRL